MHILNIVTSPRGEKSASRALVDAFLRKCVTQADDIVVDTLDVWQERLGWLGQRLVIFVLRGLKTLPASW